MRIVLFCCLFFSLPIFAGTIIANEQHMAVQIIKYKLQLDNDSIEKADIIEHMGVYKGLEIRLKPAVAKVFAQEIAASLNHEIQIELNKIIVSATTLTTMISSDFLITGISKMDAQNFIDNLKVIDDQRHPVETNPLINPLAREELIKN